MSWTFRKRIKVLPGIHVNLGKRGASISAGVRGASVTVGKGRVTKSVGLPGTGIAYRETTRTGQPPAPVAAPPTVSSAARMRGNVYIALTALFVGWLLYKLYF